MAETRWHVVISFQILSLPYRLGNFGTAPPRKFGPFQLSTPLVLLEKPYNTSANFRYLTLPINQSCLPNLIAILYAKMPPLKPLSGDNDEAPRQFKQPSRKGKKAWRKNVDVTDVQKGLEERIEQIIQG